MFGRKTNRTTRSIQSLLQGHVQYISTNCKDSAEAEDVMQESFLNAFTKLHTFKGDVTFGAWLKRIVINNSIYHYRKQQKKREVGLDDIMYKVEDKDEVASDHGAQN